MPKQLILSHSKRALWQQCHRKFHYSYVMGLKPTITPKAMLMGTVTHLAIDNWLKQPERGPDIVSEVKAVDGYLGQAIETYFNRHAADEDLDTLQTSVPFNVHMFTIEDEDTEVWFSGEIDAIAKWKKNNSLWIVERKSTGQIPSDLVTRFNLDDQVRGYTWVARKHMNLPVEGAIEDIIRFTKHTELVRDFVQIDDRMLDEWYSDMIMVAHEIAEAAKYNRYPMSPHSCHIRGKCPYNDLCLNPDRIAYATEVGYDKVDPHEHEHGIQRRTLSG